MTDIKKLATMHLERHYNSMQNVKLGAHAPAPGPAAGPAPPPRAEAKDDSPATPKDDSSASASASASASSRASAKHLSPDSSSSQLSTSSLDSFDDMDGNPNPLSLDIAKINSEDKSTQRNLANNQSFRMDDDKNVLHIDGFQINHKGIRITSDDSAMGDDSSNINPKETMVELAVLGRGASGVVRKALHVPSLTLVAQKNIPVFEDEKRHQMVREIKALYSNLVPLTKTSSSSSASDTANPLTNSNANPNPNTTSSPKSKSKSKSPRCSHIVSMYDAFMDRKSQSVTLVVEYMDGGSLQDIVDTGGCPFEPVLANIAARVLAGLSYLHNHSQIHRDIKPANLLINHHGNVKISDLGILRDLNDAGTNAAETFTGTFTYMSPERIAGHKYSYGCDIWSLGLSVMTVALGRFPYDEAAQGGYWSLLQALKEREPPRLNDQYEGDDGFTFSDEFEDFISLCLTKNPADRPSADDLLKHPFVRNVDISESDGDQKADDDGDEGGSETARCELDDIVNVVIDYYRSLWIKQSKNNTTPTVPNFNKTRLVNLKKQLGLPFNLVQRKMKNVLRQLKSELMG